MFLFWQIQFTRVEFWLNYFYTNFWTLSVCAKIPLNLNVIYYDNNTINVPEDAPSIQAAVDVFIGGDTIFVAPGIYNENINTRGKNPILMSTDGPEQTIIDGNNLNVIASKGNTVINGFTLRNGVNGFKGERNYSYTIENCIFTGNSCSGIYAYYGAQFEIIKSIFNNNLVGFKTIYYGANSEITNCSFYSNNIDINFTHDYGSNNILNVTNTIALGQLNGRINDNTVILNHCDVDSINCNAYVIIDENSINSDPLFVDPDAGNFNLQQDSPCIDSGDPNSPSDPDGTIIDMGARYFDQTPFFPIADFIADTTTSTSPMIVTFSDLSEMGSLGYTIIEWEWDFDNDEIVDSTNQNPVWTYYYRGNYSVSLYVSDGIKSDTEIKNDYITVINSEPVVIDSAFVLFFDEDSTNVSINLNNIFSDADLPYGDSLSFSYSDNTNIQIDLTESIAYITNVVDWFGTEIITFTATDDQGASISEEIPIIVYPINDPPILEITGTFEAAEDEQSQIYNFSEFCTQVWGETDSLSLSTDNSENIEVSIDGFNVLFESSMEDWYGTEEITFYLDDNVNNSTRNSLNSYNNRKKTDSSVKKSKTRDTAYQTISVTINQVNDEPILEISGIFEANEDLPSQIYDFSTYCSQVWGETDSLTLSATNSSHIDVTISGFNVTFQSNTENWFGSSNVTFYLDDNINNVRSNRDGVEQMIQITINPINDPPILDIDGIFEAEEDQPSQTYDFSEFCIQTWGETDSLTLTAEDSEHISVTIIGFDVVFESNTENWFGTEDITFYLNDNVTAERAGRDTVYQTISVIVNDVNDTPNITLPDVFSFAEDDSLEEDFTLYISDIDEDTLILSVIGNTEISVDITEAEVTFASSDNWFGSETLVFTVDDNRRRATASDTIQVIVTPVNDPPILDIDGTFEAEEDQPSQTYDFSEFCTQTWGETDSLTLTAEDSEHISVTIIGLDVVFESNTENWFGTEDILFYLDDNVTTARADRDIVDQTISFTVHPINDAPEIILPEEFTFAEDGTLVEDFSPYISDIDADDLVLSVTGNTEITVDISGAEVSFNASENWFGSETLTFTVDDNQTRATAEDDVLVTVTSVDDAPQIIYFSPEDTLIVINDTSDITQTFDVSAYDVELDQIIYSWFVDEVDQGISDTTFTMDFLTGEYIVTAFATAFDLYDSVTWQITSNVGNTDDIFKSVTKLNQNVPNPFNPGTVISYQLAQESYIEIEIYNIKGQCVCILVNDYKQVGSYEVNWNGRDSDNREVCSGIYFYLLKAGEHVEIKKMVLLK